LEELGPPLSLLLTSARWLTCEAAALFRRAFAELYQDIVKKTGTRTIDAINFWYGMQPLLFDAEKSPAASLVPGLQARWAKILAVPEGRKRVQYEVEELRARVRETFYVPAPGWSGARYHSPDLMIAAASVEDIRRGDFELVMGELHVGANTLRGLLWLAQHPAPQEMVRAYEMDFPERRVIPVAPKHWPGLTTRTQTALLSPKDFRLLVTADAFGVPQEQALPIGSLVVEEQAGEIVLRTRDGRLQFDLIEMFGDLFSSIFISVFSILPPRRYTPRINFDKLVVARETWRFTPAEMEFAFEKGSESRFVAARRWMKEHELPRFVFIKTPIEVKPLYVDFESPVLINIFTKMIRHTSETAPADTLISVIEMHPNPEQVWLPDAAGRRFTSEFRIVALDPSTQPSEH
jgi:hypothetical protein